MASDAPGQPKCKGTTSSSILLSWPPPSTKCDFQYYEIKYKQSNEKVWRSSTTKGEETDFLFTDLKSQSAYVFKVRVVFESGDEGSFSSMSKEIKTEKSPIESIKKKAIRLSSSTPEHYQLPVCKEFGNNSQAKTRKCIILKEKKTVTKPTKTIMVVGPTGSGKSTLIEGMLNYILGVSWDDNARFSVVDLKEDEKRKEGDQTLSQTDWITSYSLNWKKGFQIDFNLNIIDTPGFGDTRGIVRDKQLVDQIRTFFTAGGDHGIDELNAVCFIVKSTEVRLTPTMRYIFDSILSLFGKDIEKHIHVLMTFADGDEPPALNALKAANVPFEASFVFNNSALFVDPAKSPNGPFFWKMGKKSFEDFFSFLRSMEARSLRLTSEVLLKRRQLEVDIANIQMTIREGTDQLSVIRQEEQILDQHKTQAAANVNFKDKIKKPKISQVLLPPGTHTTTCLNCNRTCHEPCAIADNSAKKGCWAMTDGVCRQCPDKCIWSVHKNSPYRLEYTIVEEEITYEDLKKKYEQATEEVGKKHTLIDKIKEAFNLLRHKNLELVKKVRVCLNELEEIALRGNPLSSEEYIEILMKTEQNEKKPGYEDRYKMLEEMKQQAVAMKDIVQDKYKFPGFE